MLGALLGTSGDRSTRRVEGTLDVSEEGGKMRKLLGTAVALVASLVLSIPASADELKFEAELSGEQEVQTPPVVTDGEGEAKFETDGETVVFELKWDDLSSSPFAAHIHCAQAGVNGVVGVTLFTGSRETKDEVEGTFTAPDAGNGCGWDDLADVLGAMSTGGAYVNVHTGNFPNGEIRGQVEIA
jgi:hypothetical protein